MPAIVNTVVIMTSNVRDQDALRAHFRPEFLNRIDEIVFFDALSKADIRKVIDIQLRSLLKRTLQRRVLDPLAMGVLQGDFKEGDTVVADAADGHVALRRA